MDNPKPIFNPGDIVICIEGSNYKNYISQQNVELDKIYVIDRLSCSANNEYYVKGINCGSWFGYRFKKLEGKYKELAELLYA